MIGRKHYNLYCNSAVELRTHDPKVVNSNPVCVCEVVFLSKALYFNSLLTTQAYVPAYVGWEGNRIVVRRTGKPPILTTFKIE